LHRRRRRRRSDSDADPVGHRPDRRGCDRLPRSHVSRGCHGPAHAIQTVRDPSPWRLRRWQKPRAREHERKDVEDNRVRSAA